MTKNLTIKEFADIIGEDYPVATAMIKLLVRTEQAKAVGKQKLPDGQRGKPSVIYEIPNEADFAFWNEEGVSDRESENPSEMPKEGSETPEKASSETPLETEQKVEPERR
jgi:hypothetical protein